MKKYLSITLVVVFVIMSMSTLVFAAEDAYVGITFTADTILEDHSPEPDWQVIGWYDEFGVGNTQIGDAMVIPDVDFGSIGPATVTVIAGNHADQPEKQLGVYIDAIDGTKIGTLIVPNYKDWSDQQTITVDVSANVTGVHTVYVVWETQDAGSTWGISFTEKAATSNPSTGDTSVVLYAVVLAIVILGFVVLKKTRKCTDN